MSYTTFTVTVSNPGSGNKYYIDGALQATVPLAFGATYRFDQSDASNATHPLRFSTTSDGTHNSGSEYTTGVTYVGTPGQAGAYTQFVVTEVGPPATMYYYCSNHSGMGGSANLTANSWGGLYWGHSAWGDQGQEDISATGQQLASSIGTETITANADVSVTGISLTATAGTSVAGTSALVVLTGSLESMAVGQVVSGIGALTTGSQASFSIGQATIDGDILTGEGWSRGEWGEFAWGDNFSVQVTGQSLTSSIGDESAFTDGTNPVTGSQINSTLGTFSIISDVGITVFASEDQLDFSIGTLSFDADANVTVSSAGSITSQQGITVGGLKTPVDVTGIQLTSTIGTIALEQTTTEPVTGQQLAMTLGQHAEIPGQIIGVSGLSITSSLGEEGPVTGNAIVEATGITLTGSSGNVNVTAWSEVDPGVNNVWTVVDKAA